MVARSRLNTSHEISLPFDLEPKWQRRWVGGWVGGWVAWWVDRLTSNNECERVAAPFVVALLSITRSRDLGFKRVKVSKS